MTRAAFYVTFVVLFGVSTWLSLRVLSAVPGPPGMINQESSSETFSKKLTAITVFKSNSGIEQTEFTEPEIDAFLHDELSQHYPQGLRQIRVRFQENLLLASALVNFDEMHVELDPSVILLLSAFLRGEHSLEVVSKLTTRNGVGRYEILSVKLDGKEMSRWLIDLLLLHYVIPKYPKAQPKLDFNLPFKIQSIELTPGKVSVRHGRQSTE